MYTDHELKAVNPAFNPIVIGVVSDPAIRELPDFKFLVEIFDEDNNLLSSSKKVSKMDGGYTLIDVSGTIKRSYRFDLIEQGNALMAGNTSEFIYQNDHLVRNYTIEISEWYDGVAHATEAFNVKTIPAALPSIRFSQYWNEYDNDLITGKWLTNFDRIRVRKNDESFAAYLVPPGGMTGFDYKFYDFSGNEIHSGNNPVVIPLIGGNKVLHVRTSLAGAALAAGLSDTAVIDAVSYFIISDDVTGKTITVNVIPSDCRFPGIRILFMNEWGITDSFIFSLAHRRGVNIQKKKAQLRTDQIFKDVFTSYLVKFTDNFKITSNFISDNDSTALLELFTSPIVKLECIAKIFYPAQSPGEIVTLPAEIDLTSYDVKQSNVNKLFNIELEVKISVENTRQTL
ncbi:MAG: hypothetical protein ABIU30_18560 [Ferruginibacter sp.]